MADQRKTINFTAIYIFMAIMGVVLLRDAWVTYSEVSSIPYSQFELLLEQKKVKDVVITENHIRGTLTEPLEDGRDQFVTNRVEDDLAQRLNAADVEYSRMIESTFFSDLLSWVLPVLLFLGIWMFLMRRMARGGGMGGQLMSIGKSKARIYVQDDTQVKFGDVAGVEEAKTELVEVVEFLKDQKRYGRLGARMPKGVLLVGPPGTGKTLLAKAIAGEAGVPFFTISGSEFVEMFVGVGAARVRDLFEQARQKAPCIIFIDELDALGRARGGAGMTGGHDEKEQTLNQLLVEMDGFDSSTGLILIAATNRPEVLDPALLRAGRFDRQILVDRPDKRGRLEILHVHVRKIKLADEVNLDHIAALTPGFSGADLANLVNEAALIATRHNAAAVTNEHFTLAIERLIAGLEKKNRLLNTEERRTVAYHEMGHAIVAESLPSTEKVHKVSIIPRGIGSLGYTIPRPTEERYLMSREELIDRMAKLMGGRAAEKIVFGKISTGASDDISKATNIAREMVTRYGMDEKLGNIAYEKEPSSFLGTADFGRRLYSEDSAKQIDSSVRELVDGALRRAEDILRNNEALLHESAELLLKQETLTDVELKPIFSQIQAPAY